MSTEDEVARLRNVLYQIARGETDEILDRDDEGKAVEGVTRELTREEMIRMAQHAIRTNPPRRPVRKHTPGTAMLP